MLLAALIERFGLPIAMQMLGLTGAAGQPASPAQPAPPAPNGVSGLGGGGDQSAVLLAALAALQPKPVDPPAPLTLPRSASVIASVVVIGFFLILAAIAGLLLFGITPAQEAILAVLCVGFGVLASKFGTVVDFLFGSSWGSRAKDAVLAQPSPPSAPVLVPVPVPPTTALPAPVATPAPAPLETVPSDTFLACAAIIDKWEGGYSNDPGDSGGPTNHGVTQAELGAWLGRSASIADVKELSLDTAHQIFRKNYWDPLLCDQLPAPLALMTFNCGVNSGISRGAKFLQQVVGSAVDGEVGPDTVAAAAKADVVKAVKDYSATYEAFYRSLGNFGTFGRGWLNRLADVKATALSLAAAGPRPSGAAQGAPANQPAPIASSGAPGWLSVANGLLGLEETEVDQGSNIIIEMAQRCGPPISGMGVNSDTAWCALFINYCLHAVGLRGTDALLALDFTDAKFADRFTSLKGPVVGAIATKHRSGGGHVFFVLGRDAKGEIVAIGGNQSNMVCDDTFNPDEIVGYVWPSNALPVPTDTGLLQLPVVAQRPHVKRNVVLT